MVRVGALVWRELIFQAGVTLEESGSEEDAS